MHAMVFAAPLRLSPDRPRSQAHVVRRLFAVVCLLTMASTSDAARSRTRNFEVHAPTQEMADEVGRAAEHFRRELSLEWTGQAMANWSKRCPIHVKIADGAGGATTFSFDRGEVFGWRMEVQGSMQRILDSVLPHEISHTIFACHFRRPLPRWADEGAATLVEHESERRRQTRLLSGVIRTSRRIPLSQLLSMTEYPTNHRDVLTLYAEGYSLADLLVQEQGKATYLRFLDDAHRGGWPQALRKHYGYPSVAALESRWHSWVTAGSPPVDQPAADGALLAGGDAIRPGQFAQTAPPQTAALASNGRSPTSRPAPSGARGQTPSDGLTLGRAEAFGSPSAENPPIAIASNQPQDDFGPSAPLPSPESWGRSKFDQIAAAAIGEERDARGLPPIGRRVGDPASPKPLLKSPSPSQSPPTSPSRHSPVASAKLPRSGVLEPVYRRAKTAAASDDRSAF